MATVNTKQGDSVPRTLSVQVQTVEVSVLFLAVLIVFTLVVAWSAIQYAILLKRAGAEHGKVELVEGKTQSVMDFDKDSESGSGVQAPKGAQVQDGRKTNVAE